MESKLEISYLRTEKHEENICQEKKKSFCLKLVQIFRSPPSTIQAQQCHAVQANNRTQCHAVQANSNTQETICMQTNCIPIINYTCPPSCLTSSYKNWKDMDSSILRLSTAYAQEEVLFSPNNIFQHNIMSIVLIVKEKK